MTDREHAHVPAEDGDLTLTPEERAFRTELLEAARRLDVPAPGLQCKLDARLALASADRGRLPDRLSGPRPLVMVALGLAACVALALGLGRGKDEVLSAVEPESPAIVASAGATPSGSSAQAKAALLVWDGDTYGRNAQGWAGPPASPKNKSTIEALGSVGFAGTIGLKWRGEGPDWIGFGWNWHSWSPPDAGTDISGYDRLVFKFKGDSGDRATRPRLDFVNVSLGSSRGTGKKTTQAVKLSDYLPDHALDSQWHEVAIPLKHLYAGEAAKGFDPRTAWEFRVGEWATHRVSLTFYFDEIGFESTGAQANGKKPRGK